MRPESRFVLIGGVLLTTLLAMNRARLIGCRGRGEDLPLETRRNSCGYRRVPVRGFLLPDRSRVFPTDADGHPLDCSNFLAHATVCYLKCPLNRWVAKALLPDSTDQGGAQPCLVLRAGLADQKRSPRLSRSRLPVYRGPPLSRSSRFRWSSLAGRPPLSLPPARHPTHANSRSTLLLKPARPLRQYLQECVNHGPETARLDHRSHRLPACKTLAADQVARRLTPRNVRRSKNPAIRGRIDRPRFLFRHDSLRCCLEGHHGLTRHFVLTVRLTFIVKVPNTS